MQVPLMCGEKDMDQNCPEKNVATAIPNAAMRGSEDGFSLIEVAVAMVVVLIALLGVFFTMTYVLNRASANAGATRCQSSSAACSVPPITFICLRSRDTTTSLPSRPSFTDASFTSRSPILPDSHAR